MATIGVMAILMVLAISEVIFFRGAMGEGADDTRTTEDRRSMDNMDRHGTCLEG